MPKSIRTIFALALAAAMLVMAAGCGSSDQPASTSPAPWATAAKTPGVGSTGDATATPSLRETVHSDIQRIMADIKAAEERGEAVDGAPVGSSSNPYDYVGISPVFIKLVALGRPALPAIVAEIESSDADGLREYLLAAAGAQISGDIPGSGAQTWGTGKEWARQQAEEQ